MVDIAKDVGERAQQLRGLVETSHAEVASEDRSVRALVGPGGSVQSLEFSPAAFRRTADELGELIVAVLREGRHRVEQDMNARVTALLGESAQTATAGLFSHLPSTAELRRTQDDPEQPPESEAPR